MQASFQNFKQAIAAVLPPNQQLAGADAGNAFAGPAGHGHGPEILLQPTALGDIQAIVRAAHQTSTALTAVSSGAPHHTALALPSGPFATIDFSRMQRVIRIDEASRAVRIEPGVTYAQLVP
ncbi:MAG: FAD-binding protein, partial [Gammaproteobacteria bacterium]|nr:FAD-binding protein [Gammaproteobacteria bacterium]